MSPRSSAATSTALFGVILGVRDECSVSKGKEPVKSLASLNVMEAQEVLGEGVSSGPLQIHPPPCHIQTCPALSWPLPKSTREL